MIKNDKVDCRDKEIRRQIKNKMTAYMNVQFTLRNLDENLIPYVMELSRYITPADKDDNHKQEGYESIICTSTDLRQKLSKRMGVTEKDVNKVIYKLTKEGVFHSFTNENGKKIRSKYYVADWIFRRDEWKNILTIGDEGNCLNKRSKNFLNFNDEPIAEPGTT